MRVFKWFLIVAGALALVLGVYGFWTVRRSFPQVDGEIEVAGLRGEVEVIRDDWGVAHVYAENAHDLFFAQGYTHAQERFWQMDFWRHIGSGRLSEFLGSSQLETDKFLRSLGLVDLAMQELETMDPEVREILEWYSEGVNAYLADHSGAEVSLEYAILPLQNSGYEIEPWTPINILTWAKMMAWDLGGNMRSEITRAVLSADLGIEMVEELYPEFPARHPVIVPDDQKTAAGQDVPEIPEGAMAALHSAGQAADSVWDVTGGGFEGIGSNNWVIGGSLTETGRPILANDPHLGIRIPSIWFANGLHCVGDDADCPYQLVGFSFPGTPGVIIGHNQDIAWGVTNEAADTQDLFIEKLNPENSEQYEVEGEWVDFDVKTEIIEVAGDDDVVYHVRSTRHGPIISGTFLEEGQLDGTPVVELPGDYAVALSWTALSPATLVEAIIGINRATNYEEFAEAAALWDIAPQNLVFADTEGNIAYHSTGSLPTRAKGEGRYPVPGWTSEYEWTERVPFDRMPFLLNPPRGYVETANQAVLRPGSDPFFTSEPAMGYRANRIEEMILSQAPHDVESVHRMQMDNWDGGASNLVPVLLSIPDAGDAKVRTVHTWLRAWQGGSEEYQSTGISTSAAVYQATWRHVLANTFHDELPEERWPTGGARWFEVVRNLLGDPQNAWWDNVDTNGTESMENILFVSMTDAYDELVELLGDDPDAWEWGRLHIAHFENQTFGRSGIGPVEWLFNRTAPERLGGGSSIVNAVGWDADKSFLVDWIPSMRMVVDLSDLSNSTFLHTTGNSGHAFHPFYTNMIEPWTDGIQAPMYWDASDVMENASSTLILVPAGD